MTKCVLILVLTLALAPSRASAAFLDTGEGARPLGMGSVFTAIADDANTLYYNPAGLGQLLHPQFTADYGRLYLGLTDGSNLGTGLLGVVVPLHNGAWGTMGLGASTLQLVGSYQEDSYILGYGREILPGLYAGANAKLLHIGYTLDPSVQNDPLFVQHGTGVTATSFDLGLLYRYNSNYVIGLSGQNINHPNVALQGEDNVPATWRAAFAYYQRSFLWSAEVVQTNPDTDLDLGAERWFYRHMVAGRVGFQYGSRDLRNLTLGASLRLGNAQVDYSFLLPMAGIDNTAGTQQVALTVRFGKVSAGPIALLEQEELLGPDQAFSDKQLEALKLAAAQQQAAATAAQAQVAELDRQLKALKEQEALLVAQQAAQIQAAQRAAQQQAALQAAQATVAASSAPVATPVPVAPAPAPVAQAPSVSSAELQSLKEQIDSLEQELQQRRVQAAPAPAPSAGSSCTDFKRPGVYVVQNGDTLQSIAAKTLCDPDLWAQIYVANKDRIDRGGSVMPGQTLLIP